MESTQTYEFMGHTATVIVPEHPNGKWIWKTEFLYAFDQAERALVEKGYTRVYYSVSDQYGCPKAIRLMHLFHLDLLRRYPLETKANLFGFSRGGLYAFNYARTYPEYTAKVYLDAPVLDLSTWPHAASYERTEMFGCFTLTEDTLPFFDENPIKNFEEYFALGIPTLLVAGGSDEVVPFPRNGRKMIEYAKQHGIELLSFVKPECGHHPHSLEDPAPIVEFIEK